eukprot:TRINITY_DN1166_c0_g2_i2.p1 TRINITY_DN1166_c0_g2~~TRINITY_DN1166_c0_g2_i2.p1  ORF type:complete len:278 (-),score=40.74 TRINITY_DN1166_c0_g2_i2:300-1034(-)
MNEGAYISPTLFVGPHIWHQANVKLYAIEDQIISCENILIHVLNLQQVSDPLSDPTAHKVVNEVIREFDNIQNTLSKNFPFIEKIEKEKKKSGFQAFTETFSKTASRVRDDFFTSSSEGTTYFFKLIQKLFSICLFIEKWAEIVEEAAKNLPNESPNSSSLDVSLSSSSPSSADSSAPSNDSSVSPIGTVLAIPATSSTSSTLAMGRSVDRIIEFFEGVVIALVIEDLKVLLSSSLQRLNVWNF